MKCCVGWAVFARLSILWRAEWIVNDGETKNDQAKNDPVENDGDCMQMRKKEIDISIKKINTLTH